jgi:type IV pilus assembly protein PilM
MGLFGKKRFALLGLDIGASAVRMVQLRPQNGGYVLSAAGLRSIASSDPADRHAAKHAESHIAKAISACFDECGATARMAVCGVSGPEVAVRHFKFPALPAKEIPGAVMLEAEQVCPFNVKEGAVDYQLIPNGDTSVSGILVACSNGVLKRKERVAHAAGLKCVLMDVDGLALLNALQALEKTAGRTIAVLNVGEYGSNLAILGDDGLPFVRDIACGRDTILERVAELFGLDEDALKKKDGSEITELLAGETSGENPLARACQKLVTEVMESLRYYSAQRKSGFIDRILVCGAFAATAGLIEMLNARFPTEVRLWNPFENMSCEAGPACAQLATDHGPALAVACGLAMRTV